MAGRSVREGRGSEGGEEGVVGGAVHQAVGRGVRHLDLGEPAFAFGIGVDEFGLIFERFLSLRRSQVMPRGLKASDGNSWSVLIRAGLTNH